MAVPPEREREREPLSKEEAVETFERLRMITSGLLRVPKAELDQRLAEKRVRSRKRMKSSPPREP
jgi:hypothetical protein